MDNTSDDLKNKMKWEILLAQACSKLEDEKSNPNSNVFKIERLEKEIQMCKNRLNPKMILKPEETETEKNRHNLSLFFKLLREKKQISEEDFVLYFDISTPQQRKMFIQTIVDTGEVNIRKKFIFFGPTIFFAK